MMVPRTYNPIFCANHRVLGLDILAGYIPLDNVYMSLQPLLLNTQQTDGKILDLLYMLSKILRQIYLQKINK